MARPKAAPQRGNSAANAEKLCIRFIELAELNDGARLTAATEFHSAGKRATTVVGTQPADDQVRLGLLAFGCGIIFEV
jgi:hypothetical protein